MIKSSLFGACLAFIVISFFVFGVDNPKPEWGEFWIIRPLLITPLAGAIGGLIFHFIKNKLTQALNRYVALIVGSVVFLMVLWTGVVLGLAGTMWD